MDLKSLSKKKVLVGVYEPGSGALLFEIFLKYFLDENSFVFTSIFTDQYFQNTKINCQLADKNLPIKKIKRKILKLKPDFVLVGASAGYNIEKKLIIASREMNITVISFLDHYWNLWQRFSNEKTLQKWYYLPNYIFVQHKICKEKMISLGCNSKIIKLFKNPILTKKKKSKISKINIKSKLNINIDSKIIIFVSEYSFPNSYIWNWEQADNSEIRKLLIRLLDIVKDLNKKNQNVILLIKKHPSQKDNFNDILINYSNKIYKIINDYKKYDLFKISDYVVGLNSIMLVEAVIYGCNVYSFPGKNFDNSIKLKDLYPNINNIDNLKKFNLYFS